MSNRRNFSRAAPHYKHHAHIQTLSANELDGRLDFFRLQPRTILDLGCGTGLLSQRIHQRYPDATLLLLDWSESMLRHAKPASALKITATAQHLPIKDSSLDLIVSNAMIQWSPNLPQLFAEVQRCLTPEGAFLFATYGAHSLHELRQAWLRSGTLHSSTNPLPTMRALGDAMLAGGLCDPVLDIERHTLHYPSVRDIIDNIRGVGSRTLPNHRRTGLMGKDHWLRMISTYSNTPQGYPLTWEIIQGHAFKNTTARANPSWIHPDEITRL